MFDDRTDAGNKLAERLDAYRDTNPLVLAIPKGGIEVGARVALALDAEFSILMTRKLPLPDNPEAGFGAVAEDGSVFMAEDARARYSEETIGRVVAEQRAEIARRIEVLRQGQPLPDLAKRTVILVDDGIAMGSTMRASIELCRSSEAQRIIAAAPVASPRAVEFLETLADAVVTVLSPPDFRAVADVYADWHDVDDAEALDVIRRFNEARNA